MILGSCDQKVSCVAYSCAKSHTRDPASPFVSSWTSIFHEGMEDCITVRVLDIMKLLDSSGDLLKTVFLGS